MTKKALTLVAAGSFLAGGLLLGGSTVSSAHAGNNVIMAQDSSKGQMLSVLLYTDVDVQFDNTEVRDAINFLSNILGIQIIGRYSDDRTGFGIDPTAPVTLNAQRKPAMAVLEMILDQVQDLEETSWQLRNGFVEVGTKDRLDRYREIGSALPAQTSEMFGTTLTRTPMEQEMLARRQAELDALQAQQSNLAAQQQEYDQMFGGLTEEQQAYFGNQLQRPSQIPQRPRPSSMYLQNLFRQILGRGLLG